MTGKPGPERILAGIQHLGDIGVDLGDSEDELGDTIRAEGDGVDEKKVLHPVSAILGDVWLLS
jgi:hypothetical protein